MSIINFDSLANAVCRAVGKYVYNVKELNKLIIKFSQKTL